MNAYRQFTIEMFEELKACVDDPVYFINNYVKVGGETLTLNPNQLNDVQDMLDGKIAELGSDRATGRTTLGLALALWNATFGRYTVTLVVGHSGQDVASKRALLLDMHNSLPEWMQQPIQRNNHRELSYLSGSKIVLDIASIQSGRGYSISLLFVDNMSLLSKQAHHALSACINVFKSTGSHVVVSN